MVFGILDTRFIDLPQGLDVTYLEGLRTRAGVSFAEVLREIDSRLAALNGNVDPFVAQLLSPPTTEQFSETTAPSAFVVDKKSEYTVARPQMVEGQAIMLPIYDWEVSLEFTEDGLESMSLASILNNVDSMVAGYRRRYRLEVLRKLFSIAEERFSIRTTASAPGFAGSGTGTNVFTRPYPNGTATATNYTLYYRDTTTNTVAVILSARDELKRWQDGPFDLWTNATVAATIKADAKFASAGSTLVRPADNVSNALVDPAEFLGVLDGDIRVHKPLQELTSDHFALVKTRGNFAQANPLMWRYDALRGRPVTVRSRSMYPLDMAIAIQRFGIGVNNRVSAALGRIAASGNYTDPTFVAA